MRKTEEMKKGKRKGIENYNAKGEIEKKNIKERENKEKKRERKRNG